MVCLLAALIDVLRNHKGGRQVVSLILMFAYVWMGGKESFLHNHNLEKK
jgi:hypothetical protein